VKSVSRKQADKRMIEAYQLSQQAACRLAGVSCTSHRYWAPPNYDEDLRQRMKAQPACSRHGAGTALATFDLS